MPLGLTCSVSWLPQGVEEEMADEVEGCERKGSGGMNDR